MKLTDPISSATLLATLLVGASAGDISVIPAGSNQVLYEKKVTVSRDVIVSIDSDFPVSSLRYNDHGYYQYGKPIFEEELVIAVISECSEEELGGRPIIAYQFAPVGLDDTPTEVSYIQIQRREGATDSGDDVSLLQTSSFNASWDYHFVTYCNHDDTAEPETANPETANPEVSKSALRNKRMKQPMQIKNSTAHNGTSTVPPKSCTINVEILHDGCRMLPLAVSAPTARVADVFLQDERESDLGSSCEVNYTATLTFPQSEIVDQSSTEEFVELPQVELPQVDRQECYHMVEGRPFIDQSGNHIQAFASSHGNGWCTDDSSNSQETSGNLKHQSQRKALGREWSRRALGEHASVASFAAFTIALMSNNAPPQLIQDSLTAAADEVRHAKVSFQAASKFLDEPVEPGPLPASAHQFGPNLTALALATAQEGCIDETLSALVAAAEVDDLWSRPMDQVTEAEREWLMETMRTIAEEEGGHSALAWRTVLWVCQKDRSACEAVKSSVFDLEHLTEAVGKRLEVHPAWEAEKAWEQIHSTLIPFVTQSSLTKQTQKQDTGDLLEWITQRIIGAVMESSEAGSVKSS